MDLQSCALEMIGMLGSSGLSYDSYVLLYVYILLLSVPNGSVSGSGSPVGKIYQSKTGRSGQFTADLTASTLH